MLIMDYCQSDLTHYITKEFYNISWSTKLSQLYRISNGLYDIHDKKIFHRDFHNGNTLMKKVDEQYDVKISDLGLSKSVGNGHKKTDENYITNEFEFDI